MKAYHFLKDDMTGGYGDEPAWKVGEEREVEGKLIMFERGYHASPSFHDALQYAKGNMACIVELSGEIIKDTNKYVARKRKLIDARNAEKELRAWGCDRAERALRKAKVKDKAIWNSVKVVMLYNGGKATKEELEAACSVARSMGYFVAHSVAYNVAHSEAYSMADSVARSAAYSIAHSVARYVVDPAAYSMAYSEAHSAEIRRQKRSLNKLMKELFS